MVVFLTGDNFQNTRDLDTATSDEVTRLMEEGKSFDSARYTLVVRKMAEMGINASGVPEDEKTILFSGSRTQDWKDTAAEMIGNASWTPRSKVAKFVRIGPRAVELARSNSRKIADFARDICGGSNNLRAIIKRRNSDQFKFNLLNPDWRTGLTLFFLFLFLLMMLVRWQETKASDTSTLINLPLDD
eukprot:GEMP01062162.1.p1 GENE.GEMP01062162.1~~GEMP01062162.1.p1  ORF type:complete len:187 (+),score=12.72 GEMP01062162.1:23-583(+)